MKRIVLLLILCIVFIAGFTQTQQPANPPSVKSLTNYYQLWGTLDSAKMFAFHDTTNFRPKYGTVVMGLDSNLYINKGNGGWWQPIARGAGLDSVSKLNDTTALFKRFSGNPDTLIVEGNGGVPSLQSVTNAGNSTTNAIVAGRLTSTSYVQSQANSNLGAYNFVGYNFAGTVPIIAMGQTTSGNGYMGLQDTSGYTAIYGDAGTKTFSAGSFAVNSGNVYPSTANTDSVGTDRYPFAVVEANVIKKNGGTATSVLNADGSTQTVTSGTYTPNVSSSSGLSGITVYRGMYLRVGNVVSFSGSINYTTTGTLPHVIITLPVGTSFSGGTPDLTGSGTAPMVNSPYSSACTIVPGGSSSTMQISFYDSYVGDSQTLRFTVLYVID